MIISIKDSIKLFSIIIISFCAVYVCTFFLNFYLDAVQLKEEITEPFMPLYNAQLSMSKFTCMISGGFLSVISLLMLIFYIKLYIDEHLSQIGILKAIGYSNMKIAKSFFIFGFSVFLGTLLGYIFGHLSMPMIYEGLQIEGIPKIEITFHPLLILYLIIIPTAVFSVISFLYAYKTLDKPVMEMIKNKKAVKEKKKNKAYKETAKDEKSFLSAMQSSTIRSKKMLALFFAISCFCFSAMVQMSFSMQSLTEGQTMWQLILGIGLVLAFTSTVMSLTSLINGNKKNIAMMKIFGYNQFECIKAIFFGYIPFAIIGFIVGTIYQAGLLSLMVNVFFKDVAEVFDYSFNVPVFFGTLVAFIIVYLIIFALYYIKLKRISIKEIMLED